MPVLSYRSSHSAFFYTVKEFHLWRVTPSAHKWTLASASTIGEVHRMDDKLVLVGLAANSKSSLWLVSIKYIVICFQYPNKIIDKNSLCLSLLQALKLTNSNSNQTE